MHAPTRFRSRVALATLALALGALAGCDIGAAPGEDGNVRFRTEDAMFAEYAYAVGVRAVIEVELTADGRNRAGDAAALSVHSSDEAVFTAEWEEPGIRFILEATGAGSAHIEIRLPDGGRLDRVLLSAEAAERLAVAWPKPLSTLFGPPPEDIAFDLAEVRIVEGGAAANLHVDILDASDGRLAGRVDVDVSLADESVVTAGRAVDSDGALLEGPVRTNGSLALVPLSAGETTLTLASEPIEAERTLTVHVVPAEAAVALVVDVDVTREAAADPSHAASALIRVDLRDEAGRTLHGGRCRLVNETPEIATIAPEVDEGESGICWFLLGASEDVTQDVARAHVTETVTGLELEIEIPVGVAAEEDGEEDTEV
jgi:hypothetical protein